MNKVMLIGAIALLLGGSQSMFADVTIKRHMTTSMFGMPASEMTITEQYQGTKNRNVIEYEAPGAAENNQSTEIYITLPENGTIWIVNDELKTYEEMPLSAFAEIEEMAAPADAEDPFLWTSNLQKLEEEVIKDLKCSGAIITVKGVSKDDSLEQVLITYEQWVTENTPVMDEITTYENKFREVAEINPNQQQWVITKMIAQYCPDIEKLLDSSGVLKGFPVKVAAEVTVISEPVSSEENEGTELTPFQEAAAMARYLMGQTGDEPAGGPLIIFSFTSDLLEISTEAIDQNRFKIPDDYEKQ